MKNRALVRQKLSRSGETQMLKHHFQRMCTLAKAKVSNRCADDYGSGASVVPLVAFDNLALLASVSILGPASQ